VRQDAADDAAISTGRLPAPERVAGAMDKAHERFRGVAEGKVPDYIPSLARVPARPYGLCVAGVAGQLCDRGGSVPGFSIQGIAKAFVFASQPYA